VIIKLTALHCWRHADVVQNSKSINLQFKVMAWMDLMAIRSIVNAEIEKFLDKNWFKKNYFHDFGHDFVI
jgi:hypothetical protein